MAKFKYRFATLLKIRESAREERQRELAEAYHADEVLRQRQEDIAAEITGLKGASRDAVAPGTIDVDRLLSTQRYEMLLRAQSGQIGKHREQIGVEIERRRQAVVQANREVRVLEKLRERQAERHRDEEACRDIKLLDEVAGRRPGGEDGP
jgi:flagellar FliJ protein